MTENTKELTIAERVASALSIEYTEAELKALAAKYADVTEIKDPTDYELVKSAAISMQKVRTAIEKAGKLARDDANAFAKAVIAEERRLVGIFQPEENRLKALRKAKDDEEERKAEELRQIEARRVADITDRILSIKRMTEGLLNASSAEIQGNLEAVQSIDISEDTFAEFHEQAAEVRAECVAQLTQALEAKVVLEAQQAEAASVAKEQAEERARLEAEKAEVRRQQEEIERQKREAEEAAQAEERARIEEEQEAARIQAAKEKAEALRPDHAKLASWAAEIACIPTPDVESDEAKAIVRAGVHDLGSVVSGITMAISNQQEAAA